LMTSTPISRNTPISDTRTSNSERTLVLELLRPSKKSRRPVAPRTRHSGSASTMVG
jgi:hypothetical protein